MNKQLSKKLIGLFLSIVLFSCVKDTDFDQNEDILLTPEVELDLIFFNLVANDFFDEETMNERLIVQDTTEIRFLDDEQLQENLVRADFLFQFTNSIPRTFDVTFQFLNTEDQEQYVTGTSVTEGSVTTPVITEFTETVEGDELLELTMADRVVVTVEIASSTQNLEGALNLQSKATYFLEINTEDPQP